MSHLSEQEILECIAGEPRPQWRDHIQSCPDCSARARQVSEPLRLFAESIREMAPIRPVFRQSRSYWHIPYWSAFVAAALLLLIAAPLFREHRAELAQPAPAVSDEVLLQRVQTAVAESVPGPMAPLAITLSGDSENAE
jgi:hypothetical protein